VKNTLNKIVATFELIHPAPRQLQDWKAEELPATKTDRELSLTLQRLQPVAPRFGFNESKLERRYFAPEYALTENGQPSSVWEVQYETK
jgi:hypothetical protein